MTAADRDGAAKWSVWGRRRRQVYLVLAIVGARLSLLVALFSLAAAMATCGGDEARPAVPWRFGEAGSLGETGSLGQEALALLVALGRALPMPSFLLLALVAGWFASRCYLYERYTRLSVDQERLHAVTVPALLSSQEELVDRLADLLRSRSRSQAPLLLALKGGWGAGKSVLLYALKQRLENPPAAGEGTGRGGARPENRPVVVYIDIWRHSTEPDLHLALFEALLAHPRAPGFPAFFRYPLLLLPVIVLRSFTKLFVRGQVEIKGFRAVLSLPALLWQRALERVVAGIEDSHLPVVWVLDEIDRCSSSMAQAAISLARRALNLPGTVVVLPYVPEQLRFKVFNPLQPNRFDIGSTLNALIWDHLLETAPQHAINEVIHPKGWPEMPSRVDLAELVGQLKGSGSVGDELTVSEPMASIDRQVLWNLVGRYGSVQRTEFRKLSYLFEEKYLAMTESIPPVTARDVGEILTRFETVRGMIERIVATSRLEVDLDAVMRQAQEQVERGIQEYRRSRSIEGWDRKHPAPYLRHLEGEIRAQLGVLLRTLSTAGGLADGQIQTLVTSLVMAVLLGYHVAWKHVTKEVQGDD